jgi:hypothetical protein
VKGDRSVKDDEPPAETYKIEGGEEFQAGVFYEYNFNKLAVGGRFAVGKIEETKKIQNGQKTDWSKDYSAYWLQVYVPVHFNPTITLLPSATVGVANASDFSGVESATYAEIACSARFTF